MDEIPREGSQRLPNPNRRGNLGTSGTLGQQGFNVRLDIDGREATAVAAHWHTVRAHQELLKVPGNVVAAHRRPDD